jgi:hypothetical protein
MDQGARQAGRKARQQFHQVGDWRNLGDFFGANDFGLKAHVAVLARSATNTIKAMLLSASVTPP